MTKRKLNFDLAPTDFHRRPSTYNLPFIFEAPLSILPETVNRASIAVKFCWFATVSPDDLLHCGDAEKCRALREGFLRAALAEFVSMEDALGRDLQRAGIKETFRIYESENPHLHIVRELRNLEVHLRSTELKAELRTYTYADRDMKPVPGSNHESRIWTSDLLRPEDLMRLNNAKYYSRADLDRMCEWFNEAQLSWGLPDVVFRAVLSYCDEIRHWLAAQAGSR